MSSQLLLTMNLVRKKSDRSPHVSLALNLATSDTSLTDDASVQLPILSFRLSNILVRSCTYTFAFTPAITRHRHGTHELLSSMHASICTHQPSSSYRQNRTHPRMHGRRQAPRGCAVRIGNPTNVQHVYVSPVTLTLQFMHASTARRPLSALPDRPQLTGSLNTTANLPTRFNVQVQSPRGVHNRLPFGLLPTFVRSYLYFGARSVLLLCRARHPTYARTPLWIFQ